MKIAVLISGGVDSSVALRLLRDQGHNITAFYLKIWLEDELSFLGDCPWEDDLSYVRSVCEQAGVPLEVIPLQKAYWDEVVAYTIATIKRGYTPNPDILCNQRIKFGAFLQHIDHSFDKVATGHYAQVFERDGIYYLRQAPDPVKDQTYFLSHLSQAQLARALFPIGHLHKSEVRQLAEQYDLPNKTRKDSQGICFLGKFKFSDFIRHHVGEQEGVIIEYETGKILGKHRGFWFHTIGQRQGLGLSGGPWYVVAKKPEENVVVVSREYHSEEKSRNIVYVQESNWFAERQPALQYLQVKMRHGPHKHTAMLESIDKNTLKLTLLERDQGIAPGQFAVFYDGDICLGGGTISGSSDEGYTV